MFGDASKGSPNTGAKDLAMMDQEISKHKIMRMSWFTWWTFFCSSKRTLHRKYKDLYARGST